MKDARSDNERWNEQVRQAQEAEAQADLRRLRAEVARLQTQIHHPVTADFLSGVSLEAAHQRERWGRSHDAGKTPADWFWLVGYLAGKALHAAAEGRTEKALHHTISTAAALLNWHAALRGQTDMRPGIDPPAGMEE